MSSKTGKLIVIEGTDGSGKATQAATLVARLKSQGHKVATFSFPQYENKSAGLIEKYLAGCYGPADSVNPYAASLFYALDRFDISEKIRKLLADGFVVVADRYVDSNAGHQGGKISDDDARSDYLEWLYDTEYRILQIPKPDVVIILRVPAETAQKMTSDGDGHESNLEHLRNAENAYLWLSQRHHNDHPLIECAQGGHFLSPVEIHNKIYELLKTRQLI
ncbi:MAG: thymidylate kinase [bacterium]|nr:thymidylate kinase [bacterium]